MTVPAEPNSTPKPADRADEPARSPSTRRPIRPDRKLAPAPKKKPTRNAPQPTALPHKQKLKGNGKLKGKGGAKTARPIQATKEDAPGTRRSRFRNGSIAVLGLVGGLGAGKSTVAAELEHRGAFVLNADVVGHALLQQRPAREEVVRRFGVRVLDRTDPAGETIDRKALGEIVFKDVKARKDLEKILHPLMRKAFEKAIARVVRKRTARLIVLDAAILYEAGWNKFCDLVAFVSAPESVRLARLAAQRGWSKETLQSRQSAQWPLDQKRELAEITLENDSDDPARLADRLDDLWQRLTHRRPPPRGRTDDPKAD